jgi:hypothetical protein
MAMRQLLWGVVLAGAGLWLGGCSDVEKSGCKNLIGDECIPVPPEGTMTATPNPAVEGKTVRFQVHITDPNPEETINCLLDPEGDGSFQLTIDCKGSRDYIFQETGTFKSAVQATDGQGQTIVRTVDLVIAHAADGVPVTEFKLLDSARLPVTGATVCVIQANTSSCDSDITITETGTAGTYMASPALPRDTPDANNFKLQVTQGATTPVTVVLEVRVDNDNVPAAVTFITPFDCSDPAECADANAQGNGGTIATLSGVVTNADGQPVANAQVSISGGNTTGGPYSTVFTNDLGQYDLLINVGSNLTSAIANSSLLIFAEGFNPVVSQFSVTPRHFFGLNFSIEPIVDAPVRFFRETFEPESATSNLWSVSGGLANGGGDLDTKWQLITNADSVENKLVSAGCVLLAPGDTSSALLPNPAEGTRAYWYGNKSTGSFIGILADVDDSGDGSTVDKCTRQPGDPADPLIPSGGTSESEHSGSLTSPPIDLTGASSPVRLTLKTFWEIESVNPNSGGYDFMSIFTSTDDGATFDLVGRLNPLSDPVGGGDRSGKPYSNTGFNAPPTWVQQETFVLPDVAGKVIRLRFSFDTNDALYNGFRGWMIDDVIIEPGQGTLGDVDDN